jgi:hypothetical protein
LIKIKISENLDMEEDELKVMNPNIKVLLTSGYSIDQERLVGLLFRGMAYEECK